MRGGERRREAKRKVGRDERQQRRERDERRNRRETRNCMNHIEELFLTNDALLLPSSYVRYASSFFLLPSSFKRLSKRDYVKTRLKVIQGKGLGLFAVDDVRPGALIHEYVEEREREREGRDGRET